MERLDFTENSYSYGLDFGTYRSIMAVYDPYIQEAKVPQFFSNQDLNGGVPSLFWYNDEEDKCYIGDEVVVRNGELQDPQGVCKSVKMKLKEENMIIHNRIFIPSEIAMKEIAYIVEKYLQAIEESYCVQPIFQHLVVGVPVSFNAGIRGNLKHIIERALSFNKSCPTIYLIPEPVLAAIAYKKLGTNIQERNLLVFDMGAGTFDVAYLETNNNRTIVNPYPYIIKKQLGSEIAGDKIDEAMTRYIIEKCGKENPAFDPTHFDDKTSYNYLSLKKRVQKAKENLSRTDIQKVEIHTLSITGTYTLYRTQITREEFETYIAAPLIDKNIELTEQVLSTICAENFDIVLVGGSCYIPYIKRKLLEILGVNYNLTEKNIFLRAPEIAVALGAAHYSADPTLLSLKSVYGYGYKVFKENSDQEIISIVIPSEVDLPITTQKQYVTRFPDQTVISLDMYEVVSARLNNDIPYEKNSQNIRRFNMCGEVQGYSIEYDFKKTVAKGTPILVSTTLTENGTLRVKIDDYGLTDNGTIRNCLNSTVIRNCEIELELSNLIE